MINKSVINKGRTFQKKIGKQEWMKFKELLLQTKLNIVQHSENELFVKIPGEERADIEIFPIYNIYTWNQSFVHIQLWFYDFKTKKCKDWFKENGNLQHDNIVEAMNYINDIIHVIAVDKRLNKIEVAEND